MRRALGVVTALFSATLLLFAATVGPSFAGTGADDSSVGGVAWTDPGNVTNSDNVWADATSIATGVSHYVKATNFFFTPFSGTVDGIECEVEQYGTVSGTGTLPNENSIRLVNGAGTIVGDNKSTDATLPNGSGNEVFVSYGGAADDWNASLVDSDISDADFGCVFAVDLLGDGIGDDSTAFVDSVRITVTFTSPSKAIITESRNAGRIEPIKGERR